MITLPELAGVEVNLFLLVAVGLGAGVLSGFAGVGGAFVVTPALIILGFPANFAVGTSLAWVVGNSLIAVIRHSKLGNVDMKLGSVLLVASSGGVEVGVRLLNWVKGLGLADEVVLTVSIFLLLAVGGYTLSESLKRKRQLDRMFANGEKLPAELRATPLSHKLQSVNLTPMLTFAKSQVTISLWIVLAIGFFIGILSGLIGVGGGFIMVPSLVYAIGLSSFMAVGTDLFQIVFVASYGALRHTMSGNVVILVALIMVVAASFGVQFGVLTTRHVRGVSSRLILAIAILLFALGSILKLVYILSEERTAWLETGSLIVTFGGLGLTGLMILVLFWLARRCRCGQKIPGWCQSLVIRGDQ
ncbi:MAG: sulfite exporter TauE/SafE family protein [Chloroflexi bacterium]|nr:sulfite exporter TauE/SafE family protein [Chloroflexota bacterium]